MTTLTSLQKDAREKIERMFEHKEEEFIYEIVDSLIASTLTAIEESVVPQWKKGGFSSSEEDVSVIMPMPSGESLKHSIESFNACRTTIKKNFEQIRNGV